MAVLGYMVEKYRKIISLSSVSRHSLDWDFFMKIIDIKLYRDGKRKIFV